MVQAYVLVKVDVGSAGGLVEALRDVESVDEAHVIAGDWDLILELDAPEVYDVLATIAERIRGIEGVVDTRTYVSLED